MQYLCDTKYWTTIKRYTLGTGNSTSSAFWPYYKACKMQPTWYYKISRLYSNTVIDRENVAYNVQLKGVSLLTSPTLKLFVQEAELLSISELHSV